VSNLAESKTYVLLLALVLISAAVVGVAAAFGQDYVGELFETIRIAIGGGVVRGATNDGVPKAVAAYRNGHAPGNPSSSPEIVPPVSALPSNTLPDISIGEEP